MRLKWFLAGIVSFLCLSAAAQTVPLSINLRSSTRDSINGTTIQILSLPDSQLLQSRIGKAGINAFQVRPNSKYVVTISSVNTEVINRLVVVGTKAVSLTIELVSSTNTLNSVTVRAQKPLMKQEDDKTVVDAEQLAASSTNAYEVLEKAPGIVLDQDGNVYLTSSTPATIYINGRQMRMSTEDITALLKSLPAGSISRIEILRTPSAKYDAANAGGIVNVVLKKGIKLGTTGSVNLRYDQGVYGTVTAGFSLNHSVGKLNAYLSYQYTHRNYYEEISSARVFGADTILNQHSFIRYSPVTNYIGGGVDLAISRKFDIAYDLRLTATGNNSHTNSSNDFVQAGSDKEYYQSQTPISNLGTSLFISNSLIAKYTIDSLGSSWNTELDYTYNQSDNRQAYTNYYLLPPAPTVEGNGTIFNPSGVVDIKSDLSLRLRYAFTLEAGFKISLADNRNDALYFTKTGGGPEQPDPYQTNQFEYRENIYAGYLQLTKNYKSFTFKAGLRWEHTGMDGHQIIPSDTSFSINRDDLFPYVFIKKPLFKIFGYPLTGNAIFRRSITRPTYDALNPSPKFVDPFTYNVGNPDLRPQFTTNYEINATYNEFPVFAIGMNNTQDVISPVTYQNDATKIGYRTYDNLGTYKEIYGRLFGGLPAGHKYFMYAGVQYNHIHYKGQYQSGPLDYERGSWTLFTGHDLKLRPTLRFNLNAWMYINGFRNFYELKNMGQINVSVTKTLLDSKLSIVVFGNDILKTNKSVFHLQQDNILVNGTRSQDSRRFGVTLRYNFGFTAKEEKKPAFEQQPVNPDQNQ